MMYNTFDELCNVIYLVSSQIDTRLNFPFGCFQVRRNLLINFCAVYILCGSYLNIIQVKVYLNKLRSIICYLAHK